ncbi:putative chaperone DNAJ protein [Trypanosoma cruzi]|uniref:Chaperone DnaJ protein, putative n=2 Tax=Trypanosoma cruzi TaxID=5693 RepID=Q4DGH5_TRYCC|nr:chaperone DnaJ protein, putative [Trypanosoma cruzi]EAN91637.1 chaperone DnaJ protein, putative [Trypanosoma cruzi]PWV10951.1 putative chaperone DNAJ protein [Trypanosoma cruzi]RNC56802.1 putative chaperone DNAJ protein [Trypanosoma cruzi]|eukprot:XP_813488.1 chaperone DnaJ protein [Trypanosoma cruzi strain CL Brener]
MRQSASAVLLPLLQRHAQSIPRRHFNVIQRGNDREVESLFALLGFGKESEVERVRRTRDELRQGYLREAMKLKDPQRNAKDAAKLADLRRAYTLLSDDQFRARYASHHCVSPDATLHVHVDGGQKAANFNPEHQSFEFVDHALSFSSSSLLSSCAQRSFGDFTGPFQSATGVYSSPADAHPYQPRESSTPQNGNSINFMLRISFDESILGCTKSAVYEKDITCSQCSGDGRQVLNRPRKCPQCRGRGSTHLPSATYHIERSCGYCGGKGVAPPPKCGRCGGAGVIRGHTVSVPIDVRPGTTTMTVRRFRGKGHDGVRGGNAGDLIVTVLVQEHRLFHRDGIDLHMVLPIPLSVALLGGVVSVPTLHGAQTLRIPPCVRNGQRLTMDGQGVCLDGESDAAEKNNLEACEGLANPKQQHCQQQRRRGHLYVHLLVVIPRREELTGAQRCALESFAAEGEGGINQENGEREEQETPASLKQRFRHWMTSL